MVSGEGPGRGFAWPLVMQTGILILAMLGAWWNLADPRQELKDIRSNYLTIREHNEFRDTVKTDIKRLEENIADLRRQQDVLRARSATSGFAAP